jgi:hypothetical protein
MESRSRDVFLTHTMRFDSVSERRTVSAETFVLSVVEGHQRGVFIPVYT